MIRLKNILKKINFHTMILYIIIFVLTILIVVMYLTTIKTEQSVITDNININEILEKKETKLIYVYSNKSNKCNYCNEVSKYLNDNNISYLSYNIENVTKDNYNEFLKYLKIDKKVFGYPALIYIKEGEMFANIINIDNKEVLENFISDYELKFL